MNIFRFSEHPHAVRFLGVAEEQWTENPVFAPRDAFAPSHGCEHE
jgi:hypothetical protein